MLGTRIDLESLEVFGFAFASVYSHCIAKAERKGRTREEVHAIIHWLNGKNEAALQTLLQGNTGFTDFRAQARRLNPNAAKITGVILRLPRRGFADPLLQKIRYLDKLIDEMAKGRAMGKSFKAPSFHPAPLPLAAAPRPNPVPNRQADSGSPQPRQGIFATIAKLTTEIVPALASPRSYISAKQV